MGKSIYRQIKKVTPKELESLREGLRSAIVQIFKNSGRLDMAKFAETMNNESIEYCLHLGFSEKCFCQSLSGVAITESFGISGQKIHLLDKK